MAQADVRPCGHCLLPDLPVRSGRDALRLQGGLAGSHLHPVGLHLLYLHQHPLRLHGFCRFSRVQGPCRAVHLAHHRLQSGKPCHRRGHSDDRLRYRGRQDHALRLPHDHYRRRVLRLRHPLLPAVLQDGAGARAADHQERKAGPRQAGQEHCHQPFPDGHHCRRPDAAALSADHERHEQLCVSQLLRQRRRTVSVQSGGHGRYPAHLRPHRRQAFSEVRQKGAGYRRCHRGCGLLPAVLPPAPV